METQVQTKTRASSMQIAFNVVLCFAALLMGGVVTTLLRYAGAGSWAALAGFLATFFLLSKVWKRDGGKPAALCFAAVCVAVIGSVFLLF